MSRACPARRTTTLVASRRQPYLDRDQRSRRWTVGSSVRCALRTYERLKNHLASLTGTLFADMPQNHTARDALEQIYRYPLTENARDSLNRQLRSGITDDALVELVVRSVRRRQALPGPRTASRWRSADHLLAGAGALMTRDGTSPTSGRPTTLERLPMPLNRTRTRTYLRSGDLRTLFFEELGWDEADIPPPTFDVDGQRYSLTPVAQKRGVYVFQLVLPTIPDYARRRKIESQTTKRFREHFIVFQR